MKFNFASSLLRPDSCWLNCRNDCPPHDTLLFEPIHSCKYIYFAFIRIISLKFFINTNIIVSTRKMAGIQNSMSVTATGDSDVIEI